MRPIVAAAVCFALNFAAPLAWAADPVKPLTISSGIAKPKPLTMAELAQTKTDGVSVVEVSDYVYGGYKGDFPSPPHADLNPKKAFIVHWRDFPFRFVFSHEGSYCPWFEFPSGAAACFQFFEGNEGFAEIFNQFGRQERNSFVNVIEPGPKRVWIHWTYFGVNKTSGQPAYRGSEDFWIYPNGLILRRQSYQTLMPGQNRGHPREPIELIGLCPVGKRWHDVLRIETAGSEERHALASLDPFSDKRYDVYWTPKPGTVFNSTQRRAGCDWRDLQASAGVAMVLPLREGSPFYIHGDASGFRHDYTRTKEHTHRDTGGWGWNSTSWDHWPIGRLNSQGHEIDAESLKLYPNHYSVAGMDFWWLKNEEVERGVYYSLYGVGGTDLEPIRRVARQWLEKGEAGVAKPESAADLPATWSERTKRDQ